MKTTMMTQAEMKAAFRARGLAAESWMTESAPQLEDGSYGPVVTTYGVDVVLRDQKSGNTVVRRIPVGEVDVDAVVTEMRGAMKARVAQTMARIRAERARS